MLRFITAGESHGPGLVSVLEGIPAGLEITEDAIRSDLARRQQGHGRGGRMKIETDYAVIQSGGRHGLTIGSPISLLIENKDHFTGKGPDAKPWTETMSKEFTNADFTPIHRLRPGHADTPGITKYNQLDARNILERSSARESASRVAVGAICRKFLSEFGIEIHSHVLNIGGVSTDNNQPIDWKLVEESPVKCADPQIGALMVKAIDEAREKGTSLGGIFEIVATGVPIGIGTHIQWDRKLSTQLSAALSSINAVKGVEFGSGFLLANLSGHEAQDVISPMEEWVEDDKGNVRPWQRNSNNAGGLEGGMSNGEPIVMRAVVKPIATMIKPLPSVDLTNGLPVNAHYERSDITFVPACGVIGEAMVAFVLSKLFLEKFGGDHIDETRSNYDHYISSIGPHSIKLEDGI